MLGCVCLFDAVCQRNCRPDESKWHDRPMGQPSHKLQFNAATLETDAVHGASELIEQAEAENGDLEIIGLEAWSDGTIWVWTE